LTEECEKEIAEGCYRQVLKTIDQSRSIVNRLRERFPMVLVTNFYGNMPVVLKEFGLENIFTEIIESSVVGIRKPDSKLFALGVKALGMNAEEIAVIGDSYKKDIYPAATLGCRTIWLKSVCWEDEPIKDGHEPTFIIDNIEKLPGTIEKLV
jgi:putative hydrolase of the HAD superfamily